MTTPVLGQGGAAHRRLLGLSSKASGGRRAAARGDRRSASCQACHRPALDRGRWRRAAGGNGERHCGAARRLLRISRVRKNPIAWKNQVFARYSVWVFLASCEKKRRRQSTRHAAGGLLWLAATAVAHQGLFSVRRHHRAARKPRLTRAKATIARRRRPPRRAAPRRASPRLAAAHAHARSARAKDLPRGNIT